MRKAVIMALIVSLLLIPAGPGWAREPAAPELTLNEAIGLALARNEAVRKAEKEIDRTMALREYKADALDYTPLGPPGTQSMEIAWANMLSADLSWRMSKKSLTVEEDAVALSVCKKYWEVQQAASAVETARQALRQAELDFNKANICYKLGLISNENLLGAATKKAGARASLAKAQNDLGTAYADFNQLIGLSLEDRPVLTGELTFSPMEETNPDYAVTKALENSPTVWLAQEKVNLQKYLEDMIFYTGEYKPYQARTIEVEQAELDAVSARNATKMITRNLFYAVLNLEENYPAAEQAVQLAEENLRVAKLKQQVGMAVAADVAAAEASLAQARQGLLELKKNHAYLKLAVEKPWAYLVSE